MTLPAKTYKTWSELAEYARRRARISAARNGHQEFVYWLRIVNWANTSAAAQMDVQLLYANYVRSLGMPNLSVDLRADIYAHAVHCRQMLINLGEKVERLSLNWLREAAEKL